MSNVRVILLFLAPVLLSLAMHWHVLARDLAGIHVWRQTQTQTVIYHFTHTDNNILHPRKFDLKSGSSLLLYEFPLFQWTVAQFNRATTYQVGHSRMFMFIIFVSFLAGFYRLARQYLPHTHALTLNALLVFSPLLYYYCVNPLPDMLALSLSTWGLYFAVRWTSGGSTWHCMLALALCSLATLAKLPYVLFSVALLPGISFLIRQGKSRELTAIALSLITLFAFPAWWYAMAIPTWQNNGITVGLFGNTRPALELFSIAWFHLVSTLPELITNYASTVLLIAGTFVCLRRFRTIVSSHSELLLVLCSLLLYFFFEIHMIERSHDYYLLPFAPLVFLVVGKGIIVMEKGWRKTFIVLAVILSPLTAWLRIDHRWDFRDPGFHSELLTQQERFQHLIPAGARCVVSGDDSGFITLYYLKRFGFSVADGSLGDDSLRDYYDKGARYLVVTGKVFDPLDFESFTFTPLLATRVAVYKMALK